MGRDPAFLFYFRDFLIGTEFLSAEEVGIYIRILCHLADKERLSEKQVLSICRGYAFSDSIKEKLSVDDEGFFYQKRLRDEVNKRKLYTESRRNNAKKDSSICSAHAEHMGNANVNVNEDVKKHIKNPKVKKEPEDFLAKLKDDPAYKGIDIDREALKAQAWIKAHPGRKMTHRFFLNWLNKVDPVIKVDDIQLSEGDKLLDFLNKSAEEQRLKEGGLNLPVGR